MKSKTLIIFLLFSKVTFCQNDLYSLRPKPIKDGLGNNCMFMFKNNVNGWMCSDVGVLRSTEDAGKNWVDYRILNFGEGLTSIIFLNDEIGFAVGTGGSIIKTIDAGRNWVILNNVPTKNTLKCIFFSSNAKLGVAVGTDGTIVYTTDTGKIWHFSQTDVGYQLKGGGVFENNSIYAFGEGASFITNLSKSLEGGKWKDHIAPVLADQANTPYINAGIYDQKQNFLLLVADSGYFFMSNNQGESWVYSRLNTKADLNSIILNDSTHVGWIGTSNGQIWKTIDGGKNWNLNFQINDSLQINSIIFSDDGKLGWVCGDNNLFLYTLDGGLSWIYRPNFTSDIMESFVSYDEKQILAVSLSGKVVSSTDGFVTWKQISPESSKTFFHGLAFDSATNTGFFSGEKGIYKCKFDGSDWSQIYSSKGNYYNSIMYIEHGKTKNSLIAVGSGAEVIRSRDKGNHWNSVIVDSDLTISLSDIFVSKKNKGAWVVGKKGKVFFSADFDQDNWKKTAGIDTTQNLVSIMFNQDESFGLITSRSRNLDGSEIYDNHLFASFDAGKTWQKVTSIPTNRGLSHILFVNEDLYVNSDYGSVFKSVDHGKTWFKVKPALTWRPLNFSNNTKSGIYIFGGGGAVFKPSKMDYLPLITKFSVIDSANYFIPHINIIDKESSASNLEINFRIDIEEGQLIEGVDQKYKIFSCKLSDIDSIIRWPKSIFPANKKIKFKILVFDGWNIVSKEFNVFYGEPVSQKIAKFFYWNRFPEDGKEWSEAVAINTSLLAVCYSLSILILFFISPRKFVEWHETIATSKFPKAEKFSTFLSLYLVTHNRSQNAFVKLYEDRALNLFNKSVEVADRAIWYPAPFKLDFVDYINFTSTDINYIPGHSEIKRKLISDRTFISIEGPGGIGKSTLAFQIVKWAIEKESVKRIQKHQSLPIFLNNLTTDLDIACKEKVEYIVGKNCISEILLKSLLQSKRIVVVVDGVSEMGGISKKNISPDSGASQTYFVIFTSRKPISLIETTVIVPLGLKLSYLDALIDGFTNVYVGANKFEEQREILRNRTKTILLDLASSQQNRPIPLLILRLMVTKASEIMDNGKNLAEELPMTLISLFENYIEDVLRNLDNPDQLAKDLRTASTISLNVKDFIDDKINFFEKSSFKPQWVASQFYLDSIDQTKIKSFLNTGLLIEDGSLGDKQYKFSNDIISEYLTAKQICIFFRDKKLSIIKMKFLFSECQTLSTSYYDILLKVFIQMNLSIEN